MTLRNVLSHHAGIPSAIVDGMWAERPRSFKTVTTGLNRYYAAYPPNTVFAYSNAGYSLAGHAIENVAGVPFVDYPVHDSNILLASSGDGRLQHRVRHLGRRAVQEHDSPYEPDAWPAATSTGSTVPSATPVGRSRTAPRC